MTSIAISNLPIQFNQDKLLSGFLERGLSDIKFYTSGQFRHLSTQTLSYIEHIFLFVDILSHSDYYAIKDLAKRAGRSIRILNRKTSSWPHELVGGENMAAAKSVLDSDLDALFQEFKDLKLKSASESEVVAACKKYWTGRPLTNYEQVEKYVYRTLAARGMSLDDVPTSASTVPPSQVVTAALNIVNAEEHLGVIDSYSPNEGSGSNSSPIDQAEWIRMLEEDNYNKSTRVNELEVQLADIRQKFNVLTVEVESLRNRKVDPVIKPSELVKASKEAALAIAKLVDLGVMSPQEGFDRIVKSVLLLKE